METLFQASGGPTKRAPTTPKFFNVLVKQQHLKQSDSTKGNMDNTVAVFPNVSLLALVLSDLGNPLTINGFMNRTKTIHFIQFTMATIYQHPDEGRRLRKLAYRLHHSSLQSLLFRKDEQTGAKRSVVLANFSGHKKAYMVGIFCILYFAYLSYHIMLHVHILRHWYPWTISDLSAVRAMRVQGHYEWRILITTLIQTHLPSTMPPTMNVLDKSTSGFIEHDSFAVMTMLK